MVELHKFLDVASRAPKTLHVLDVFGVSCRMQSAFEEKGFVGFSYDIKLSKTHDITSESGFKVLLEKAARQLDIKILWKKCGGEMGRALHTHTHT